MTDLDTVKLLVSDPDLSNELVEFYLDLSEQFIKNYCRLDEVPKELHNTMIQIAAVKLKSNSNDGQSSLGAGVSSIVSASDGSQSVSYGRVSTTKNFIGDDDLVTTFGSILDRFRRFDSKIPVRRSTSHKTRKI